MVVFKLRDWTMALMKHALQHVTNLFNACQQVCFSAKRAFQHHIQTKHLCAFQHAFSLNWTESSPKNNSMMYNEEYVLVFSLLFWILFKKIVPDLWRPDSFWGHGLIYDVPS